MRLQTALAYLLFRALDTVEDASFFDETLRAKQFEEFESFLLAPPSTDALRLWAERFPETVSVAERALLEDAWQLFEDFHNLPEPPRTDLRDCALRMSAGMRHYSARRAANGELRLGDLVDVNRYCYFVAGVVGELLTRFLIDQSPRVLKSGDGGRILLKNAFHFGLFLQKVNVLKDQNGDELEKRFLVPDRAELLASLSENAKGALEYLSALPLSEKGYRVFCAWSLFLGAASLPWIDQADRIPRVLTLKLLAEVESMIDDPQALVSTFDSYFSKVQAGPLATPPNDGVPDWFHPLSGARLERSELSELRVL